MSADLFRPAGTLADGSDPVRLSARDAGWSFAGLRVLSLAPGERRVVELERVEAVILPLSGSCRVEVSSKRFELEGRRDVFSRVTDFVYVPTGSEVVVSSEGGGEFAFPTARAELQL